MSHAKDIKNKIASINHTEQITHAMEMVATSKMRKALEQMRHTEPYAKLIREVILNITSAHTEYSHPFLTQPAEIKRAGYFIISTDAGLCGGLNNNLFRLVFRRFDEESKQNITQDLCLIGLKAIQQFQYHPQKSGNLLGVLSHLGRAPHLDQLIGIIKTMLDHYHDGKIEVIYIAYNRFINTLIQKPVIEMLLPCSLINRDSEKSEKRERWDYIYEEEAKTLLNLVLTRYIESQIYQAVLQNITCQQAAQMVAMRNATDNAREMVEELKLEYHKARQAAINKELSEIVGGVAAIEGQNG